WTTFQSSRVNCTDWTSVFPSVSRSLLTGTVTELVGSEVRTNMNEAVPPFSVVVRSEAAVTKMPALSLSTLVMVTSGGSIPAYFGSSLVEEPNVTSKIWSPSATESSRPVTTTVCGELQFCAVNFSTWDAGEVTVASVDRPTKTGIVTSPLGWE